MNKTAIFALATLLLAAGVLTLVTAASMNRRAEQAGAGSASPSARDGTPPIESRALGSQATSTSDQLAASWISEFTLTERSGRPFSSQDLNGKVHVVNFFFASCPSYCRDQTNEVAKLAREFGPKGVVFVSITCDPDRDTPAALQQYASLFNADPAHWMFLTGDLLLIRRIGAEMYQMAVDKELHTEHLVLVDRWGEVRGRYGWRKDPLELEKMKGAMTELLAETEPPAKPSPTTPAPAADEEDDSPDP